jgi:hypothetical protein
MDESLGTRYRPEKAVGGVAGIEIFGCAATGAGENPQTQNGGYSLKGTQSATSEIEDYAPQQTKNYRKCSEENALILGATN